MKKKYFRFGLRDKPNPFICYYGLYLLGGLMLIEDTIRMAIFVGGSLLIFILSYLKLKQKVVKE